MGAQLTKLTTVEYIVNKDNKNNHIVPNMITDLVKTGNLSGLNKLLQREYSIVFQDGSTMLHVAALHQQPEILKFFLEKRKLSVNAEDKSCETALNSSLVDPDTFQCSDILIAAGVNINLKNKWLRTPLLKSVIDQNEPAVLYLLDKGANPNTEDCMGCTPLNQSAYYHLHHSFNKLLEKSADMNFINRNGQTALACAFKSLNKTAATKLINNGAVVTVSLLKKIVTFYNHEITLYPEKKSKMEVILCLLISALGEFIAFDVFLKSFFSQTNLDISQYFLAVTDTRNMITYKAENHHIYFKERSNNVPSLKHFSRLFVRKNLVISGGNVVSNLKHLNIPPGLKSVILLHDVNIMNMSVPVTWCQDLD